MTESITRLLVCGVGWGGGGGGTKVLFYTNSIPTELRVLADCCEIGR